MSDSFDPDAICKGVNVRQSRDKAAKRYRRLVDCNHHDELYALFDKLSGVRKKAHKWPSERISQPLTVHVYSKDGNRNERIDEDLSKAVKYQFPNGATVTKLRTQPLTFRVDDDSSSHLVISRQRDARGESPYWQVTNMAGFTARSGKHAGQRIKGKGADKSFG
jgi:hypothetical protein